jgi:hypothetical protein
MNPFGVLLDILCVGICAPMWLPIAGLMVIGGLAAVLAEKKSRGTLSAVSVSVVSVGLCMLLLSGLFTINAARQNSIPTPTAFVERKITDQEAAPFLQAINRSNRLSLGFSPIPSDAKITIQDLDSETELYIYVGPETGWGHYTDWDIYVAEVNGTYQWLGEEETYAGPHREENIYISYWTKSSFESPNVLRVKYRGEDSRLTNANLTLDYVRPILAEWKAAWATATPTQ